MAANQIGFRSNLIATIIIFHRLFLCEITECYIAAKKSAESGAKTCFEYILH